MLKIEGVLIKAIKALQVKHRKSVFIAVLVSQFSKNRNRISLNTMSVWIDFNVEKHGIPCRMMQTKLRSGESAIGCIKKLEIFG